MTLRILPPEEWPRLEGTEAGAIAAQLAPGAGQVLVVEEDGAIVATWMLLTMVHAEGLWIAPTHRGRFGVVKRLLRGMRGLAQASGCAAVLTASVTPEVTDFIQRLGGSALPGHAFVLPMEEKCPQQ